jgi:hypothetical protein
MTPGASGRSQEAQFFFAGHEDALSGVENRLQSA